MAGSLLELLLPVGPSRSLPTEGESRQSRHTGLELLGLGVGLDTGPRTWHCFQYMAGVQLGFSINTIPSQAPWSRYK